MVSPPSLWVTVALPLVTWFREGAAWESDTQKSSAVVIAVARMVMGRRLRELFVNNNIK